MGKSGRPSPAPVQQGKARQASPLSVAVFSRILGQRQPRRMADGVEMEMGRPRLRLEKPGNRLDWIQGV